MISVEEAKSLLIQNIGNPVRENRLVEDSLHYILAEDIYSTFDLPQFDQSAVDGFVVNPDSTSAANKTFSITGEIKAGDKGIASINSDSASWIFTGAPVPKNSSCVVMQEKVEINGKQVMIPSGFLIAGSNIRRKGSQIKKGELALSKGTLINPAAVGFLSMLGITKIKVYKKPNTGILVTGNELRKPGQKLSKGQIFDSNSSTLRAALEQCGFKTNKIANVADVRMKLMLAARKLITACDITIVSGGISVGKYDLVKEVLEEMGFQKIFYKVAQKPGKPMYVGKKGKKFVFALPGNPAAALVCFYEYVLPALKKLSGFKEAELPTKRLPLTNEYSTKGDRSHFLKANVRNDQVMILDQQESNMLTSFVQANALVYLPNSERVWKKGEVVEVHLLPAN